MKQKESANLYHTPTFSEKKTKPKRKGKRRKKIRKKEIKIHLIFIFHLQKEISTYQHSHKKILIFFFFIFNFSITSHSMKKVAPIIHDGGPTYIGRESSTQRDRQRRWENSKIKTNHTLFLFSLLLRLQNWTVFAFSLSLSLSCFVESEILHISFQVKEERVWGKIEKGKVDMNWDERGIATAHGIYSLPHCNPTCVSWYGSEIIGQHNNSNL